MADDMVLVNKVSEVIQNCRETAERINRAYKNGWMTEEDEWRDRHEAARNSWENIKKIYRDENVCLEKDEERLYQAVYSAVGIKIKRFLFRVYPQLTNYSYSCSLLIGREGLEGTEELFYDENPVGKTYQFSMKVPFEGTDQKTTVDYYFKVESYQEKDIFPDEEGWKRYDGYGRIRGYERSGGVINLKEQDGKILLDFCQTVYREEADPIWKKRFPCLIESRRWLGFRQEELPEDMEEGEYYRDESLNPPRGLHYREEGILAYDDNDEIAILGITDPDTEVVKIPNKINGKPVTILDKDCFANCRKNLKKVILPDTIKEIGEGAFRGCQQLERPAIPASVTRMGENIF